MLRKLQLRVAGSGALSLGDSTISATERPPGYHQGLGLGVPRYVDAFRTSDQRLTGS